MSAAAISIGIGSNPGVILEPPCSCIPSQLASPLRVQYFHFPLLQPSLHRFPLPILRNRFSVAISLLPDGISSVAISLSLDTDLPFGYYTKWNSPIRGHRSYDVMERLTLLATSCLEQKRKEKKKKIGMARYETSRVVGFVLILPNVQ